MTAHMAFPVPTATHDVRVPCGRCGGWYWAGDPHECAVPGPTNADVLDAALPEHGLMNRLPTLTAACPGAGCGCQAHVTAADRIKTARRLDTWPRSAA